MFSVSDDGARMRRVIPLDDPNFRSQDLAEVYMLNGAVYLFTPRFVRRTRSVLSADTRPFIMPASRSVDIDTREDFELAERVLRQG
jgi:CMP-N-acetylneuraminic acid synthetase